MMFWRLDDAIKSFQDKADLNRHIADTFPDGGVANIDKCREKANEYGCLVSWLKEYKRLRSILASKDGRITTEYIINTDNASYQFNYIEGYGVRINAKAYGNKLFQLAQTPVEPMDFEEFKEWCESKVRRAET